MEKAKYLAREIQEESTERTETHMDGLKPAINNLLHTYLPDNITIGDSETIAMVINEMVWNPNDFVRVIKSDC